MQIGWSKAQSQLELSLAQFSPSLLTSIFSVQDVISQDISRNQIPTEGVTILTPSQAKQIWSGYRPTLPTHHRAVTRQSRCHQAKNINILAYSLCTVLVASFLLASIWAEINYFFSRMVLNLVANLKKWEISFHYIIGDMLSICPHHRGIMNKRCHSCETKFFISFTKFSSSTNFVRQKQCENFL